MYIQISEYISDVALSVLITFAISINWNKKHKSTKLQIKCTSRLILRNHTPRCWIFLVENRLLRSNFIQQWLYSSSKIIFYVVHQLFTASPAGWLHLIVIRCGIFLHLMGCRNNLFTDSCHALKEFGGEEMRIAFWYTWVGDGKKAGRKSWERKKLP